MTTFPPFHVAPPADQLALGMGTALDVVTWAELGHSPAEMGSLVDPNAMLPEHAKILLIDDEPANIKIIQKYLREFGYLRSHGISDPTQAMHSIETEQPDVIILDVVMPQISGLDVLAQVRMNELYTHLPILILSASNDKQTRLSALDRGATDFLSKPVDPMELIPRVRNAVMMKKYQDSLRQYAEKLALAVRQRTAELEASRKDVIHCLARAAELRDDDTGHHVLRVGHYSALIACAMGYSCEYVDMMEQAAQLHDIGKIGIPDEILLKPGHLDPEQYERMQRHVGLGKKIIEPFDASDWEAIKHHVSVGQRVLERSRSPIMKLASSIAISHHERWDGSGYPLGLAGEDIPIEGRIVAVADVFDALSSKRHYKKALPIQRCFHIIEEESGKHFDPHVVKVFLTLRKEIAEIQIRFSDVG